MNLPNTSATHASSVGTGTSGFDYRRIAEAHQPQAPLLPITGQGLLLLLAAFALSFAHFHRPNPAPQAPAAPAEFFVATDSPATAALAAVRLPSPESPTATLATEDTAPAQTKQPPLPKGVFLMEQDSFGHFYGLGGINGNTVQFMADTGSAMVMIPEKLAEQMGLQKGAAIKVMTAAGLATQYVTELNRLRLGDIELRHVRATIAPGLADDVVLLGAGVLAALHMKVDGRGLQLSHAEIPDVANAGRTTEEEAVVFKSSLEQCKKAGNKFDQHTLECLQGA
ncbi:MAG: TIGR02281 family clan AA aspartic protease [Candidatus Methylumidiphilus sp.]